ncbi:alpha/beta hydrolase family protein [Ramlibacter sp.]|uniref:alpha/beta hydrolase family protein n=1 Tax=Ramlibacter sp. TaxID=1917967 RepID=UPI002D246A73|nr:alpha/beta fold hydrolase [Ramlibacter sp.]HYD75059.1 alpha/beta fold hydrolase [Ramlibacter sp.]
MSTRANAIAIAVGGDHVDGTLVGPDTLVPGVLMVHGWDGSQDQYIARAHEIATLGCICLTFDLRGHVRHQAQRDTVTREDNLQDVLAAYDALVGHPAVDPNAVCLVGSSYGGYLAALATTLRPVRWLALRVPALYKDEDWETPKSQLNREELAAYRRKPVAASRNRALAACSRFRGDVLVVESEHDPVVPRATVQSYVTAFTEPASLTYRLIAGADHALSDATWRQTYTSLLVDWIGEMLLSARAGHAGAAAEAPLAKTDEQALGESD